MPSTPPIGNFSVLTDESGDFKHLPPNSTRFRTVEWLIDMALFVLETREGREVLADIATRLVTTRDNARKPVKHLYRGSLHEMPQFIDTFLRKIRSDFPHVYLRLTEGEGMAVKNEWGDDVADYNPKKAVFLDLNKVIINNMIFIKQQPREDVGNTYELLQYQMLLTVVHEIVHFLTGYLTGTARPLTPRTICIPGWPGRNGESGRYLEAVLFGGVVEFYEDPQDPLGRRQAGIPYLMDDARPSSPARKISIAYILDFLNGNFVFPIRPSSSGNVTTRAALRAVSQETTNLRPSRARDVSLTTSPPRQNDLYAPSPSHRGSSPAADSSSVHRRLPVYPQYRSGRTTHHIVEQPYSGVESQDLRNRQAYGAPSNQSYGGSSSQAYGRSSSQAYGRPSNQVYGGPNNQAYGGSGSQAYGGPSNQPYGGPSNQAYPCNGGYGWDQSGPRYDY